jgi:hypothetical protein
MTFEEYADKEYGPLEVTAHEAPIDEKNHTWRKEHLKTWQAATKAALGSRVVLPERMEVENSKVGWRAIGWNHCLDSIKLIPLTAEQVDSLLPSESEFRKAQEDFIDNEPIEAYRWLRESIKKRLGAV